MNDAVTIIVGAGAVLDFDHKGIFPSVKNITDDEEKKSNTKLIILLSILGVLVIGVILFFSIGYFNKPKEAEIHYILNQQDLDDYERTKRENSHSIWRASEIKDISDKPVLKSADRAGYYITIK